MTSAAPVTAPGAAAGPALAGPGAGSETLAEVARLEDLLVRRRTELDEVLAVRVAQAQARAEAVLAQAQQEAETLAAAEVAATVARTDREVAAVLAAADSAAEQLLRLAAEHRARAARQVLAELLGDEPPRAGG